MRRLVEILAAGVKDTAGATLSYGTVDFYAAGTTTRVTVYADPELDEPLSNPATLDAAGVLEAYYDGALRIVCSTSAGTVVRSFEYVGTADGDVATAVVNLNTGSGLEQDAGGLVNVNVDGSTITVDGNNIVKVPDGGIGEDQLAEDSVTEDKIEDAAVTAEKLDSLNYSLSSSCGTFTRSASSYADVTNLTADITLTKASHVRMEMIPDGTSTAAYISIGSTAAQTTAEVQLLRGVSTVAVWLIDLSVGNSAINLTGPIAPLSTYDFNVAAGAHTYKLQTKYTAGSSAITFKNWKLLVHAVPL